ncbi:peptidylprolyl isomerase [Pseudomonas sp. CAN2814]|uniref:peptidylprolyl isomerase n=1 Tax=Pseudomonas sp. CAN1 TaxID=3046726 RepID=UPI002647C401|nr:peptidylprolyl isomerase [Pseudomonas sp. CAN1]MDN6857658.1 peptidylprolyl isomerase [Pseudomonas sp. CAN1]
MSCSHYEAKVDHVDLPKIEVNGVAIAEDELARELQYHPAASHAEALYSACRALVVRQLLVQRADALGLEAEAEEGEALEEARIRALIDREVGVPEADEASCRQWYAANPTRLTAPWRMSLRHVLLGCAPDDLEGRAKAREQAEELLAELREHPERFAEKAMRFSDCPSRDDGGDLGWIEPGQTVPEFEKRLLQQQPGLLGHPLESRYGLHVVELIEREGGEPLDFAEARPRIAGYLRAQVLQRAVSQYISVLAGEAQIDGFVFDGAESPLVQ